MMGSKSTAVFCIFMIFLVIALPPIQACAPCTQPHPPVHRPGHSYPKHPPHQGGGGGGGGNKGGGGGGGGGSKGGGGGGGGGGGYPPKIPPHPPVVIPPPITTPPIPNPPVTNPPPCGRCGGGGKGGGSGKHPPPYTPPAPPDTCPINALKLGLCVDVLGGLVHVGLGNPVENVCCPVLQGLLELEAAVCLCTTIRLKLLNLNIFLPLALQALITCGITPPPGFVCPPL